MSTDRVTAEDVEGSGPGVVANCMEGYQSVRPHPARDLNPEPSAYEAE